MKCTLCGYQFDKDESDATCTGCSIFKGCSKVRCPNCGYEEPADSIMINVLKQWRNPKK
jgi:rubredoxin